VRNVKTNSSCFADFAPAEALIAASGADIRHEGEKAFYRRPNPVEAWPNHNSGDYIVLPPKHRFNPVGSYYETAFHELAHHSEVRLNWPSDDAGYPMNELVAELASSYLSQELGVPQGESIENHAAYIKIWLEAMAGDSSFIFRAATQASKVADFLLSHVQQDALTREPVIVV
jgi:antirestriction protein ArdC